MKNRMKLVLSAILFITMPFCMMAQQPRLTKVGEINIHDYRSMEERVVLLHSIHESEVFSYIYNETEDIFDIYVPADYTCDEAGESPDFETFLENCYDNWVAFSNLDKEDRGNLFVYWRYQLSDTDFNAINADYLRNLKNRDENATCDGAFPFCTDNGAYNFPAGTNAGSPCGDTYYASCSDPYACSGTPGQSSNCLSTAPNPAFYFMRIAEPGNLNIHMQSSPLVDIDFDCWGPFSDIETACSQLACSNIVDCGYSTSATENCHINNAQTGQYYILLITNFSNSTCSITFSNTGTGSTDCSILPPLVDGGGPYCVGETINLVANGQAGASYSWTGPGGFTSNQQNPSRPNCTLAMAGTYTCTITVGNQTNSATTEAVVVYAQPSAHFNSTTVCQGQPTQFTSTSTTNPSGQTIGSYQWNFGDGQTGSGQTTNHTYASAGTYQATLTVSTGNGHCTDEITQTVTVNPAPAASFNATTVCQGEPTQFTSTSTGQGINSYQWNFGDNQTGTGANANHTYAQAGTYQVTLTVQTAGGCTDQVTQTVTVNVSPNASFNATTVCQGQPTQFTSTSTGQGINSYQWNFGDNQTGTGVNPTHTYTRAGTYQVTLTVQAAGGCSDQVTQTVTVNALPTASFNATTVCQGQPTQFTSTSTGQGINSYQWNFGDNQTGTGANANHTYAQAGTYQVTLTVQSTGGCSDQVTQTVTVNAQPAASFNATTVCQGEPTQFTSTSSGQGINSYQWNFGDNQTGTGLNATHTYAQAGTYQVTLTVQTAGGCSDQVTQTVTVNAQPAASFNATTVCQGEATQFASTSTGQGINSYQWNFGDNQTGTGANATHTYAQAGTYQVTLTVQSAGGCSDQVTQTVTVNAQPAASFNATTVCQGEATQFASTSTGQGINSYQWNFGDNQTGTGANATHTYAQPGTYDVTLTVQTADGCSDQISQTVTVNALPAAGFDASTVCHGEATQFANTSTGEQIDSYQWDFGDGQTGSGQSPEHAYAQPGTYNVTLNVATADGCSDQISQTVTVNALPTSDFTATSVCQGSPTQFNSTSTGDQINGYQWNFGDGQTGNGQTISHTYAQAGTYNATLTVQTADGCTDQISQAVDVYAMPVASASATPSTILYGATTTLTANAGAQGTFNFHWEPADMVANPNSQTTQTIALQESQTFTVTVTNPQGNCTSTAQVIVSIDGSGLLAMVSADQTDLCDGESTTLHAIPSGGAAENYSYQWSPAATLSNPTSQNPVATPGLGNTTYSCHISDGFTDINLSVTLHVHPIVEKDIYQTICENDAYSFFGQDVHTPGVYDHTLHTQYGCDSIVHLHLDNWQTYETSVSDRFCQNDTYAFFDQNVTEPGVYFHTLQSQHGCDSTIRLNLNQDPVFEFEMWESTCEGGDGYLYNGSYLQPRPEAYDFHYPTVNGCDSTIIIHIEEAEYNSKNYNVSLCGTEFTWGSNGITYYESGTYYDTLHFAGTCDSTIVLNLEIRPNHYNDVVTSSCDDYRWLNDTYNVDITFTESTVYTHHYINAFGCESEATLHLTINDHDESAFTVPEELACDEYFWDPKGREITYTDHPGDLYTMTGVYHRTYKNIADCDSLVTMNVDMEYTPHPTPIYPMDLDNTAPHWVVTATEFQINAYDFNLWDTNPNCHWDTVTWSCVGAPEWVLEPFGAKGKCCKLYVLNHVNDTVWLTAHAFNRCAPDDGVTQRYWMVCSFYGLEDHDTPADFSVVPNPNKGQMTLNFENLTGKIKVKVYDMRGALLDDFETYNTMNSYAYTYQMRNRVDGIYFFVATGKEGTVARKVVIHQ